MIRGSLTNRTDLVLDDKEEKDDVVLSRHADGFLDSSGTNASLSSFAVDNSSQFVSYV